MSIELGTQSRVWKTPRIWCQCCDANSPWLPVPAPWQREGWGGDTWEAEAFPRSDPWPQLRRKDSSAVIPELTLQEDTWVHAPR